MKNWLFALWLLSYSASSSQTILPPIINCATTDQNSGDILINWTIPPLDPCGPFIAYVLFGATNANGPYLSIDTITNQSQTSWLHLGANATVLDWYYFMITLQDCLGPTSIPSDTIKEEVLMTPELDFVTVTPNGIQVNWIPNTSTQTAGYFIYYSMGSGLAVMIDTIFGNTSNTYLDFGAEPNTESVAYTIAAFDGCSNSTVFNESGHRTIFLTAAVQSSQVIALNWTPYINWIGIASYDVEVSIDGGNFTVDQHLPDGSSSYIYSDSSLVGDSVCFRISAIRQSDSIISRSNQVCFSLLTLSSDEVVTDKILASLQVYPNPFTSSATIEYTLSEAANVSLKVYDLIGEIVMKTSTIRQLAGEYAIPFENTSSGRGVFVVELNMGGMKARKRVVVIP